MVENHVNVQSSFDIVRVERIVHVATTWTQPENFSHNNYWATQQMLDSHNSCTVNISMGLMATYVLRRDQR